MKIKIVHTKIHPHIPRALATLRFGIALLLLASIVHFTVLAHPHPARKIVTTKSPPTNTPVATKPAQPAPTPPPVKTQPTPVPQQAPVPKKVVPTTTVSSTAPVPVVTPAPQSSVNSLAPVPTPSPPSSSSTTPTTTNPPATTTGYTSTNWAGWMATTGNYTSISGSWTAPHATGNGTSTSADASWIGIGGVSSNDLIQVGTLNIISASGQVTTSCFYELLPSNAQFIATITVNPGDSISASVAESSPGQWLINITDNTNGQSFSKAVSYASTHSSAEWIEEDPSTTGNVLMPLANFGTVLFSNGSAKSSGNSGNILANQSVPITLVNSAGKALATTSALGSDGGSFSVTHN